MTKRLKINLFILGILLINLGIILLIIPFFNKQVELNNENSKIEEYLNLPYKEDIDTSQSITTTSKANMSDQYFMVLEVPKISLKKGIYSKNSKNNNVNKNVTIMKESNLPNEVNGNLILAAHRGNSKVSFFEKLYTLDIGDEAYIYFNHVKYIYKLDKVYDVLKDGTVEIERDMDKKTLSLITCKRKTKDKQQVFIFYLTEETSY